MRKLGFLLLLLPFVALAVTACDGTEELAGPQMVPYEATASFSPTSAALTVCQLPEGYPGDPVALAAESAGVGQHSPYLGETVSVITIEGCTLTETGVLGWGTFTHTGSGGDAISGSWDALFTPPDFEFVANGKAHPIVFESGTGSLSGVSGWAEGTGTIDPATGAGTFSVQGEISEP